MTKDNQPYHHKNLRKALIEKGIELINTDGIKAFSLRKVAAACGVSHAAPYSHFQNKEDLLDAMQNYITVQFVDELENTIKDYEDDPKLLEHMGIAYLSFFMDNPHYFSFLYSHHNIKIDLSAENHETENYKPYEIFKFKLLSILEKANYPKDKQNDAVIAVWAFIHGITSLATMNNVSYDKSWKSKIVDFMKIFECSF